MIDTVQDYNSSAKDVSCSLVCTRAHLITHTLHIINADFLIVSIGFESGLYPSFDIVSNKGKTEEELNPRWRVWNFLNAVADSLSISVPGHAFVKCTAAGFKTFIVLRLK
jgi:hypothetical protein